MLLSCQLIGCRLMGSSDWQIQHGDFRDTCLLNMFRIGKANTESTHAMVLIPTEEEAGLNATCLAEATFCKSGMYSNVTVPSHSVSCSDKKNQPMAPNGP